MTTFTTPERLIKTGRRCDDPPSPTKQTASRDIDPGEEGDDEDDGRKEEERRCQVNKFSVMDRRPTDSSADG